jgi:hypothetical protein
MVRMRPDEVKTGLSVLAQSARIRPIPLSIATALFPSALGFGLGVRL